MNSGQYHHRLQEHGLPMNIQYSETPESLQSTHQLFAFDGLPRTQPEQNFMTPPPVSAPNLFHGYYSLPNQMSIPQTSLPWGDPNQLPSHFDELNPNGYYEYSSNVTGNSPDNPFLRRFNFNETPRCMPDDIGVHHDHNMSLDDVYGQSSFYTVNAPCKPGGQLLSSTRLSTGFSAVDNLRDPSQLSLSTSPRGDMERDVVGSSMLFDKASPFRLPSSEASEDGGTSSREMTAVEGEEPASDEPYAKLIYRALMSKPNHSMVLQEIYQWFRENTVKGSSDTKGWMNSIRHNLSMNAAFKKTERKVAGDETKKSTEWVLEDFAVKDGVQSTTRYRKGTNAKKFMKTDTPTPARQISGRRGGLAQRDNRHLKQRFKERSVSRRPSPCIGITNNMQYHRGPHPTPQRQRSPLTPPHPEHIFSSSSYFFSKPEKFDMPFENMCGLEDVQGVYIDEGPLFSDDQDAPFHGGHPMSNHPY